MNLKPCWTLLAAGCAWLVLAAGCGSQESPTTTSPSPETAPSAASPAAPDTTVSPPDATEPEPNEVEAEPATSSTGASAEPAASSTPPPTTAAPQAARTGRPTGNWGSLRGTFIYEGTAPEQAPLKITKDQEFCGQHNVVDERVVVSKETGGIANIVIFLFPDRGEEPPVPHESYAQTASATVLLDNNMCRFEPHVSVLRTTQTLKIGNSDEVGHNTKIDTFDNSPVNQTIPAKSSLEHTFTLQERRPALVSCSIHPWMTGWILVRDDPYFAVTDADGKFEIRDLPIGDRTFQVWHEKAQAITRVKQDGRDTQWSRGRFAMSIQAGDNDLGELRLDAELFE